MIKESGLIFIASSFLIFSGCADYSGEAAQLRTACSGGDKSACIDYQAMVMACISPHGLIPVMGCSGVGPQTVYHPEGAALYEPSSASANVSSAVQTQQQAGSVSTSAPASFSFSP